MKIAIPTRHKCVDDHFGHCEYYTIFDISESGEIKGEEVYAAPQGCGCKSNIASILGGFGVTNMLAGNMGQGAVNKVEAAGIKVFRGCSGEVHKLAQAFLNNEINDSGKTCSHQNHSEGHQCNH